MLREYSFIWRLLFVLTDLTISAGAFLACYWLRFEPPLIWWFPTPHPRPPLEAYLKVLPLVYIVVFFSNNYFRLYHPRRVNSFMDELARIVKSNCLVLLLLMAFFYMDRSFSYSRSIAVSFLVVNPACVFLFRVAVRSTLRRLRAGGHNLRHVLVVGTGRKAQELLHRFRRNRWTGLRVVGLISLGAGRVGSAIHRIPVVGCVKNIEAVLDLQNVDRVYIALEPTKRAEIERLLGLLAERFIPIRLVQDRLLLEKHRVVAEFDGLHIVSLWENHLTGWNAFAKRAMDIVVSLGGIILLSPCFLAIAAAVACTSRGPVLYRQKRMGHDGRIFSIIKFRTMRDGTDDDQTFTQRSDARCTPVGRFLRRTSLDELPQLVNVLLGQMSLVGPRPERPSFIAKFRESLPQYMLRHKIKAGMTGWAQINGWRGDTSLKKRLQYDLFYMHNWSLWFDVKILVLTLVRGWRNRNAY